MAEPATPILSARRTWGSTPVERRRWFACDDQLERVDDVYHRAVDVEAPPEILFRWLCQLRVAPYSYDWIDNLGRRSPRELTPGLEDLEVGQRVMMIFDLVEFHRDRHVTIRLRPRWRLFGDIAGTYLVLPVSEGRSRLVVKLVVRHPRGFARKAFVRWFLPLGDLIMMRKQLLTLKRLAEDQTVAEFGSDA